MPLLPTSWNRRKKCATFCGQNVLRAFFKIKELDAESCKKAGKDTQALFGCRIHQSLPWSNTSEFTQYKQRKIFFSWKPTASWTNQYTPCEKLVWCPRPVSKPLQQVFFHTAWITPKFLLTSLNRFFSFPQNQETLSHFCERLFSIPSFTENLFICGLTLHIITQLNLFLWVLKSLEKTSSQLLLKTYLF